MRLPLSFLKEYIQIDLTAEELSDLLTLAGIEVDSIETPKITFTGVVIAKVEETQKHPNADKLQIATVFDGKDRWQVVCGAPNCRAGLVTAFARVGATLQDKEETWTVKKATLRGIESSGMLASAKELGLQEDHVGIVELPDDMEVGKELSCYFQEPIFEVSLTPNLGHCMSILGIAKEISAHTGKKVISPTKDVKENPDQKIDKTISVTVTAKKGCPRYCLRLIEGIQPSVTPFWMKQYLSDSGLRPIHPVVDILNFVMLERGQPLHAFDYEAVGEKKILVEETSKEEEFLGLDGEKRILPPHSVVIRDPHKILALAGILGGKNSSISHTTQSILIESAEFDSITIRKTSQKLALRTDSSIRYERGIDGGSSLDALNRACHLIEKICHGKVACGAVDIKQHDFKGRFINIRIDRVNHLLGTHLSQGEIEEIFLSLGCLIKSNKDHSLQVQVPTARNDLIREIDLVEEVARIYGYNHIPKPSPLFRTPKIPHVRSYLLEKELRERLIREGLQELLNCDIISPELVSICKGLGFDESSYISIVQSSSSEYSMMRPSLLPGILQVIAHNQDQKINSMSAFELGYCYGKQGKEYSQQPMAAIVLTGEKFPQHWSKTQRQWDFIDLKGILESLFSSLNIPTFSVRKSSYEIFHPNLQAEIYLKDGLSTTHGGVPTHPSQPLGSRSVGIFGEIHPKILAKFDIKQRVFFAELNSLTFLESFLKDRFFTSLPTFPSSERDWTITVEKALPIQVIFDEIQKRSSAVLEKAFCMDIYEKDAETKNLTFRFIYRSKDKTLSHEEVEEQHQLLIGGVLETLKMLAKSSTSQ